MATVSQMRSDDHKLIRNLPLFSGMTEPHYATLMKAALLQRFPEQVTLIEEGQRPDFLHLVVDGTVELFSRHRDREATIEILSPVATFILAAVAHDAAYLKSARTLVPSNILLVPARAVREMIGRDAAFGVAMISELGHRYRSIVRALKDEKLRTGSERIANWILRVAVKQADGKAIELIYEKRKIASYLGMTPENFSRGLARLSQFGIRCRGRRIEIVDWSALSSFAMPDRVVDDE